MTRMVLRRVPLAPVAVALSLTAMLLVTSALGASSARAATQEIDPTYANGTTVYMIGPHLITAPNPQLLASVPPLYIAAYPVNFSGCTTCGPVTLPSGYHPQCDPCFHPGLPPIFAYHDHILPGAPGFGTSGTAGDYKGPWRITILMYAPSVAFSPGFRPITRDEALTQAEANHEFLPINPDPNAANPYEVVPGAILICPLVSYHA
jgi:hypothetical protein